jgi:ATP-dependent Clp protease ATP-binding subunit ClpA
MEHERFIRDHASRLLDQDDRVQRANLLLSDNSQSVMQAAIAIATERRSEVLTTAHLLKALMRSEHGGYAILLLARYAGDDGLLSSEIEKML